MKEQPLAFLVILQTIFSNNHRVRLLRSVVYISMKLTAMKSVIKIITWFLLKENCVGFVASKTKQIDLSVIDNSMYYATCFRAGL